MLADERASFVIPVVKRFVAVVLALVLRVIVLRKSVSATEDHDQLHSVQLTEDESSDSLLLVFDRVELACQDTPVIV